MRSIFSFKYETAYSDEINDHQGRIRNRTIFLSLICSSVFSYVAVSWKVDGVQVVFSGYKMFMHAFQTRLVSS